ncbi:unnamed protein product [Nezara viridula]|uniref:Neuropeptide n=1 Tax=Nezara viridula TaxID=85310 RepID=A0A9P0MDA9_NEZVI|nr:unnamed protein product [Nezara viridula]
MFYILRLVPVLIFMCVETISISSEDGEHLLKERGAHHPKPVPVELLDHLDKAAKNEEEVNSGMLPFLVPTARACADVERPAYAKATCTSYPGRVVCQLGRYTFVINNGEHKMNPEIIERFAAMVYHRSQEGDANFDISVDIPVKINDDYFVPPQRLIETTTSHMEEMRYPVFVECSPIIDERKMCNPPYNPTEIIYSCKRRELGFGGFGGLDKRMVISVDGEGTVAAGDLVLPYNALKDKRKKRQREKQAEKVELIHLTPSGADNKLYSDVCSLKTKGWCPNFIETDCPPTCRTINITVVDDCAAVNGGTPTNAMEAPPLTEVPQSAPAEDKSNAVVQPQEKAQRAFATNATHVEEGLQVMKNQEAQLLAVTILPPPQVRVFSDVCLKSTEFPWCPQSVGEVFECSIPTCITIDECAPPTYKGRMRREEPKPRHLQIRMKSGRKFGPKRIFRKRKRQALSNYSFLNFPRKNFEGPEITCSQRQWGTLGGRRVRSAPGPSS